MTSSSRQDSSRQDSSRQDSSRQDSSRQDLRARSAAARGGAPSRVGTRSGAEPTVGPAVARQAGGRTSWTSEWPIPVVAATGALLLVAGALAGVGGSFAHAMRWELGEVRWPAGLVLSLLTAAGVTVAGGMLARSRLGAVIPAGGWLITGVLFASPRPEGDLIIAGDWLGYAYLFGGFAIVAGCATLPYARAHELRRCAEEPVRGPAPRR